MDSKIANYYGFLTLSDLLEVQKEGIPDILSYDEKAEKDEKVEKVNVISKLVNDLEKEPSKDKSKNPLAVDLQLGEQVFISTKELPFKLGTNDHPSESLSIKPGEFALLLTRERVELPDDMFALISMRFKMKLKGLINVSGFHVDPGYKGKILYSVYNAGPNPIIITKYEKIFTIIFARIKTSSSRPNPNFPEIKLINPDYVSGLLGAPVSLQGLHDRIRTLEQWNKILIGLTSGVVVALISALFGGI